MRIFVCIDVVRLEHAPGYLSSGRSGVQRQEPINVLIAAHDRWTRLTVSTMLDEAGFAVEEASNGVSALRIAAVAPPHIVLLAPVLPEIAPVDVLQTLRADPRTRNTAVVQIGSTERRLAADGLLNLPCNPIELLATVVNALEARQAVVQRKPGLDASSLAFVFAGTPGAVQPVGAARG
jgi:PleD family two-component response regulator